MVSDNLKEILNGLLLGIITGLLIVIWSCTARADYVIEFTDPATCRPCQIQQQYTDNVKKEGYDIRLVNPYSNQALKQYYRITRIPTFVYVLERNGLSYDSGLRLGFPAHEPELRAFCMPKQPVYNATPALNSVRWVLGLPPLVVPW